METLEADVDALGRALGAVLREQEGEALFARVERVRALTKAARASPTPDLGPAAAELAGTSARDAEPLVRAFATYFSLVNIAEERERVRRLASEGPSRKQSLHQAMAALRAAGLDAARARALVRRVRLGLTFTAHPTEMRRRTVRAHLGAIARDLLDADDPVAMERITAHVEALWGTLELRHVEPTVLDEVKGGLAYLGVIREVLPALDRDLHRAFEAAFGEPLGDVPLPVALHSWMGGDRDGNPNVTPEVTREALALHHRRAIEALREELAQVFGDLSQHRARLGDAAPPGSADEPFRARLRALLAALREDRRPVDVDATLAALDGDLIAAGQARSAHVLLRPARVRARVFGTHLVSLDLREHSEKTGAAVAALARAAGEADPSGLDEDARFAWLVAELGTRRPLLSAGEAPEPDLERVLGALRAARDAAQAHGGAAVGRYVVSMTEHASDLLEVLVLAREVGARILPVPLFETLADLERAPRVMARALDCPAYRAALGGEVQEIMIGYSDSNKDGGFFAASWALHEVQRRVAAVCAERGVPFRFFHGRGTSIGRGGGPMARGVLGQPPGTIGCGLRVTEQGEALADRYSRPRLARRHLEQALYALLVAAAREPEPFDPDDAAAMDEAAAASVAAYRAFIEHPRFLRFYEDVTPIREFARLRIASRPVRRPGPATLKNLRAIPWVMSWNQNRANLPGWFGLDAALASLGAERARRLYAGWPFFRSMLDNAGTSLATSDEAVLRAYLALTEERERGEEVIAARRRTIASIEQVTGEPLLAAQPRLLRSIRLRNPYVDPMHLVQVELLQRWRAQPEGEVDAELERALLLSVLGIAAGVRSSG
jgi:phosphoenolpyruvate carboxylase